MNENGELEEAGTWSRAEKRRFPLGLQIEERHYEEQLCDDGMDVIIKYGIAFYKKRCRVLASRKALP